jgi:hypothetical protein
MLRDRGRRQPHPQNQKRSFAMAKRTRAPARKKKSSPAKNRKSNAERTKKAVESRRCKFSPELEARGRYLFEETDASLADIAFELGIHKGTVPVIADRFGWKRYVPPLRDVPPATRILLKAEALERRRETAPPDPAQAGAPAQPHGVDNDPAPADLAARLRRAVLNELAIVESLRERLKNEPQGRVAAERTARTLSTLTDTLQKLQRLQCAVPDNGPDHEIPADIEEFRRRLAQRIEAFVASRADDGAGERSGAPEAADPPRQ